VNVKGLSNVQMRAGMAALALVACMLLPWYQETRAGGEETNWIAISVLSWVEAAVLLGAAAVLYLLYARSQRRGFHLPGGDGWAVTIAGAWTLVRASGGYTALTRGSLLRFASASQARIERPSQAIAQQVQPQHRHS